MKRILCSSALLLSISIPGFIFSQTDLLLNSGFEDVNTCTEYNAECGVEGWFYLKDVKAQMLGNETTSPLTGNNVLGIFFNWNGYTQFSPLIGTLLTCSLQKGKQYTFKGFVSAMLNPRLILKTGVCLGQFFYVPNRPFSKNMKPDSITMLTPVPRTQFYSFQYTFIATGEEKYLTFGTYVEADTVVDGKKKITTPQTVSVQLDNFQLTPADEKETLCDAYEVNKKTVYAYNFRHREMDNSLFGRGGLKIVFDETKEQLITRIKEPDIKKSVKTDTLKLGDILFDFNKAILKPQALNVLSSYFINYKTNRIIDSIYVEGHTDSIGTDKRNTELSEQRCRSVREWLLFNRIVSADNLFMHAFGKSRPVASNKTPAGRSLNRRVEIIIFRKSSREP
jgi:outer membrane protein OmpA-like peptidoglycan-associated protein